MREAFLHSSYQVEITRVLVDASELVALVRFASSVDSWRHRQEGPHEQLCRKAEEREIPSLVELIDIPSLTTRASSLRGGARCAVMPMTWIRDKKWEVMGGMNYHVIIRFDDSVEWIACIRRRNVTSPPISLSKLIVESEVATMKYLRSVGALVPNVFDFASTPSESHGVGTSYILMEKVPGKPLDMTKATNEQKRSVLRQLAKFYTIVSEHPLPAIGSLCNPGTSDLGTCLFEDFASVDTSGIVVPLGPFTKAAEYREACVRRILAQIDTGERYSDCKDEAHLIYTNLLSQVVGLDDEKYQAGPFYLKHLDDKGDHILVDEHFNITGIIDWEWAQAVPEPEAFCCPLFLLDVGAFFDGENALGPLEKKYIEVLDEAGLDRLADFARRGRKYNRLATCMGAQIDEFSKPLYEGLRLSLRPEDGSGQV